MNALGDFRSIQGREKCCDEDYGGSHYHCGNCGRVSSMMGHFVQIKSKMMAEAFGRPVGFRGFTCTPSESGADQ